MKLSHLPLLQVQRDLYAVPRGMERFREYLKTMTDAETGDLADDYLALGAEKIAEEARAESKAGPS